VSIGAITIEPKTEEPVSTLESTLPKVYQNKGLYLPVESTLMQNRGEGGTYP
jgi:hypothetical protein